MNLLWDENCLLHVYPFAGRFNPHNCIVKDNIQKWYNKAFPISAHQFIYARPKPIYIIMCHFIYINNFINELPVTWREQGTDNTFVPLSSRIIFSLPTMPFHSPSVIIHTKCAINMDRKKGYYIFRHRKKAEHSPSSRTSSGTQLSGHAHPWKDMLDISIFQYLLIVTSYLADY